MPRPVTISYAPEIKLLTVFSEELDSVSILTPTPECQLSQRQSTSILGATVLCILLFVWRSAKISHRSAVTAQWLHFSGSTNHELLGNSPLLPAQCTYDSEDGVFRSETSGVRSRTLPCISGGHITRNYIQILLSVVCKAALYYTLRWVLDSVSGDKKDATVKAKQLEALKRLGHHELKLDEYERKVANEVIHPDDIPVTFADIGGLDSIVSSLRESVIYPLLYPNLFTSSSSLLGAPKGVLLFGPPGCGKTMLAKALAKESGATFINIAASVLTNKWYGESNKLVAGLFSLARKAQPSIIFIDEIDSFLRERTKGDHEVTGMMKAEFMTLWDGLLSGTDRILVLGATNRPNDIDSAILRRMPKRFAVDLPNLEQRTRILSLMLKDTKVAPDFDVKILAAQTEGLSGSDLRELCRNAAMVPVREFMRSTSDNHEALVKGQLEGFNLRPLTVDDFFASDGSSPLPPSYADDRSRLDDEPLD
ncbi:hypothetical protein D9613_005830 [Agrocybe pediades]|uniref:AAA+ ATPase domain-containing protein n=1 Tax=Agrocybe pediades TaxID=84607 RepID=A0A8H4VP27_9AGAR|nr:hypothetical protein D9613_005830 [Agrocybe pediades]